MRKIKAELNSDYSSINNAPSNINKRLKNKGYYIGKMAQINSEFIFNHPDMKKKTKGYDKMTGEIKKRGKPADNQDEIFMFKGPEKELTQLELIKDRKKKQAKKREAQNKKLYRQRLKTKWDRSW
jgi:hypothetical protein